MTELDRRLSRTPVRLLAVGDLTPGNGYARLLDVFAHVHRWNPRARLLVVGEGPEREALEAQVTRLHLAEAVAFPGRAERGALVEWTQRAHVFVNAALGDPRPCSALSAAMAGGLCIVSTASRGADRLLEDGVSGLVVACDDEAALSRALHLAVSNADLRQSLGEAAAASIRDGPLRKSA